MQVGLSPLRPLHTGCVAKVVTKLFIRIEVDSSKLSNLPPQQHQQQWLRGSSSVSLRNKQCLTNKRQIKLDQDTPKNRLWYGSCSWTARYGQDLHYWRISQCFPSLECPNKKFSLKLFFPSCLCQKFVLHSAFSNILYFGVV